LLSGPASNPASAPAAALGARIPDARETRVGPKPDAPANLDLIMDIPIDIQIVLGTSRMPVSSLMNLSEGALIGLDRKIGEPVEIVVNGRLFGRGEITVLEGDETRFGVKLIDVVSSNIK
jgi:flagellar motor switch protein FliN